MPVTTRWTPSPPAAIEVERVFALGAAVTATDLPGDRPLPRSLVRAFLTPSPRERMVLVLAEVSTALPAQAPATPAPLGEVRAPAPPAHAPATPALLGEAEAPPLPSSLRASASAGELVGMAVVGVPKQDNRHLAWLEVQVHPGARRRGIGQALVEEAASLARAEGRRELVAHALVGGAGDVFATALGASVASTEAEGRIDEPASQLRHWEELAASARRVAARAGFALERVAGPCPAHLAASLAQAKSGMNDAPTGALDLEPRSTDVAELRAVEASYAAAGVRQYRVLARRSDGQVAGYTELLVGGDDPGLGRQEDTTVLAGSRGHRLGLWLKAEMLVWLAAAEPGLRVIQTWNDVTNAHMLAVNDLLGSRRVREWQTRVLEI